MVTHDFFKVAVSQPTATALAWKQQAITYGELAERVSQIVNALPDPANQQPVVAITGETCPGFIAALVAVMHRGAIALPIDSRTPPQRQALMLESARVSLVIQCSDHDGSQQSQNNADGSVENYPPILKLACNAAALELAPKFEWPVADLVAPGQDPTYLFFTSGTTGKPKPVIGRASSLMHFVTWQRTTFNVSAKDRVAQLTNLSFDPCLREIYVSLTSGATLLLPTDSERAQANQLLTFIKKHQASIVHTVPTLSRFWLRCAENVEPEVADVFTDIRLTLFAGEPLTRDLVRRWRELAPNTRVVNLYGPTETTLAKFFWKLPEALPGTDDIPVGRPLPDTGVVIIDGQGNVAQDGELGEVYIDTKYSSCGYLQTNGQGERDNPFIARIVNDHEELLPRWGSNFYRTGDLGLINRDGLLVIRGRADDQIKISGVRINPIEVAEILKSYSAVKDAFVGLWENRLTAWYVCNAQSEEYAEDIPLVSAQTLRQYAIGHLLPAMVPSSFFCIDEIPLTPNGKINKSALYQLAASRYEHENNNTTKKQRRKLNDFERRLGSLWKQVLEREPLYPDVDFFALGGDSLKALELTLLVQRVFEKRLQVIDIFDTPQLDKMSEHLENITRESAFLLPRSENNQPDVLQTLPLSAQQAAFKSVCMASGDASWCCLSRLVPIPSFVSSEQLRAACQQLIIDNDALRLRFPQLFSHALQELLPISDCNVGDIPLEVVDCREQSIDDANTTLLALRASGSEALFDLACWPLFKLALVYMPDGSSVVVVWAHHLILDGFSFNVLIGALSQYLQGLPNEYDAARASYREYITWEQDERTRTFDEDRAYWQQLLADARPLSLPEADHGAGFEDGRRGCFYVHRFDDQLVCLVRRCAEHTSVTPFVIFLGAYMAALGQLSGRRDLLVNIPVQVRPHAALQDTVGVFFSQVLMRMDTVDMMQEAQWPQRLLGQLMQGQRHYNFEFHQRLALLGLETDNDSPYPLTTALFNINQVAEQEAKKQRIVLGHQDLGRALRFQLQGELQILGDDMLMSYLYRRGVLPEKEHIEAFADSVANWARQLCDSLLTPENKTAQKKEQKIERGEKHVVTADY